MNSIEVILLNYKGHSLHEFINKDEPLCPVIDFDFSNIMKKQRNIFM